MDKLLVTFDNLNKKGDKINNNDIKIYLPWVEKYRPHKIDDIIFDNITRKKITSFLKDKILSNMIITGNPGTGKTTTILCLAREIYADKFDEAVIELNASDNRGLDTINNTIVNFCQKKVSLNGLPKLIILDEADNITKKAQNTLYNLFDTYDKKTKFVLTCNDFRKLVEGIQTRCLIVKYNSIDKNKIIERLKYICNKENITYDNKGIELISILSNGDMRLAINYLESTYYGFNRITSKNIYKICNKPSRIEVNRILGYCMNGNLRKSLNEILLLKNKGYCNNDLILSIIDEIKELKINEDKRINLLDIVNQFYIIINNGIDTDLQLLSCLSNIYNITNK